MRERFFVKTEYVAGGLERVEKVEPDPLNLSVNAVVGKHNQIGTMLACLGRHFSHYRSLKERRYGETAIP
ncbi:hypothetical protein [Clostridium thermosuccinogenes]|uniref:hypothetical protein n=1 Tax=Clostridium thermosuccinogenes TaxID=84032 RepID=UPI003BEED877